MKKLRNLMLVLVAVSLFSSCLVQERRPGRAYRHHGYGHHYRGHGHW